MISIVSGLPSAGPESGETMKVSCPDVLPRRRLSRTLLLLAVLCVAAYTVIVTGVPAHAAAVLLSQGRPTTASSSENASFPAADATDGDTGTRWSSAFSDPQWLQVDLGATSSISQVTLDWEAAFATAFQIQTSDDGVNWTTIFSTTTGTGGVQTLTVSGTGRFVRMNGTARGTQFGYSLFEFQVFGVGGTATAPPTSDQPDFGPNVHIFDPSMSAATVQSTLDSVFAAQQNDQFGTRRDALLFKPGTYDVTANVGYYTQLAGLGQNPDAVGIDGGVTSDATGNNATLNFWREVENMSITPSSGTDTWAVSQGASMRRVDVHGNLKLDPTGDGFSSGGFLADSRISGQVTSGSQQQWLSRNDSWGSWAGNVWNMVFVGTANAPAQHFPNPSFTTIAQTPTELEKPYIFVDAAGDYHVFVPSLQHNTQGVTWGAGNTAGTSLPMHDFYVTRPGDTAATMNAALAAGLNLIVTPGVYQLDQTLTVTHPDTIILGMGLATLQPVGGITAIATADVGGVQIDDLLITAGTTSSGTLVQIGPAGASSNNAADPDLVADLYFRVGGDVAGKATTSLVINEPDTIGDNNWLWRADHGTGVGWTSNTADTGLVVNGADTTMYGLAVEHYQKTEVLWNANGGSTYFFQNENPYDPPTQADWMNGTTQGFPAYEVAPDVTTHQAFGVGSYCFFQVNPSIVNDHAFQAPVTAGVQFHDTLTVSLGGVGTISHVINETGAAVNSANTNVYLPSFP
jgi:hypothetical protein